MRSLLLLLLLSACAYSAYPHPLFSTSFAEGQENITTYTFRTYNNYTSSTLAFKLMLSSYFTWFDPTNFTYALEPDGIENNSPYWDVPPVLPNESAEVSFVVRRQAGLPGEIAVKTETIDRWTDECSYLSPYNSTYESAPIYEFLRSLGLTQNVTVYYEKNISGTSYSLAFLKRYGVFGVFSVNGTNVSMVSDEAVISHIVSDYADAKNPEPAANISSPYAALKKAKNTKAGPEAECLRISGMDRFPCTDRESCLHACFSVPVCSMIGQSGWPFLDTLQDYNRTRDSANRLLDDAILSSELLMQNASYLEAKKTFDDMVALNRAETRMIFHPLIRSYGFCQTPEYAMPEQIGARRDLLDYLAATCLHGEEERIINESIHTASKIRPPPIFHHTNFTTNSSGSPFHPSNATIPPSNGAGSPAPVDYVSMLTAVLMVLVALGIMYLIYLIASGK